MTIRERLKRLKHHAGHILRNDERASMKREFSAFMDMHPIRDTRAQVVPRASRFAALMQPSYAVLGLTVAAFFTVSASELSLPNESLYAIKTGVNERVLLASTYFSPVLHAQAGHTIFARRLEEAEQLMLLEQFRAETADEVQSNIDQHAEALNRSIARAEAAGEAADADALRKELASTLEEHDPLLDILALRKEVKDTEIIDNFIREVVHEHTGTLKSEAAEAAFADIEYEIMSDYANTMLEELETLNETVAERVHDFADTDDDTIPQEIVEDLAKSNTARAAAEAELREKDPEAALDYLKDAIETTRHTLDEITDVSDSDR